MPTQRGSGSLSPPIQCGRTPSPYFAPTRRARRRSSTRLRPPCGPFSAFRLPPLRREGFSSRKNRRRRPRPAAGPPRQLRQRNFHASSRLSSAGGARSAPLFGGCAGLFGPSSLRRRSPGPRSARRASFRPMQVGGRCSSRMGSSPRWTRCSLGGSPRRAGHSTLGRRTDCGPSSSKRGRTPPPFSRGADHRPRTATSWRSTLGPSWRPPRRAGPLPWRHNDTKNPPRRRSGTPRRASSPRQSRASRITGPSRRSCSMGRHLRLLAVFSSSPRSSSG